MTGRHKRDDPQDAPTPHRWTANHYVISIIIVVLAVGPFAYSWS